MSFVEYLAAAALTWFVGFVPGAEVYVAIPVGLAAGLHPISALAWAALGNTVPLLLIDLGYERLRRIGRIDHWLAKLRRERVERLLDHDGAWLVSVATPILGVWTMALAAKGLGMASRPFTMASVVSVFIYAVIVLAALLAGIDYLFD